MNEKTPRQIGEEAKALYAEHEQIELDLRLNNDAVETCTERIHFYDSMVRAHESTKRKRVENVYGHGNRAGLEGNRNALEEAMSHIGSAVLSQGRSQELSFMHMKRAAEHYRENESGYRILAIAEAALDGVQINVQKIDSGSESIEVNKQ